MSTKASRRRFLQASLATSGLLGVASAQPKAQTHDVYLPAGTWYDFRSLSSVVSRGEWLKAVPLRAQGVFQLPLYARAGSIVPMDKGSALVIAVLLGCRT